MGAETRHVVIGAILVGFVMAFLVPSTTARVACLVPITLGIIAAFGVSKKGAFASMLMITTTQTASIWNVGIKTAAAQNMVAIGFIEKTLQKTITWLEWFMAAAPFAHADVGRALFRHDAHDAARSGGRFPAGARRSASRSPSSGP